MSLADDMEPASCIDLCQETVARNLIELTANLPVPDDGPEELAKKYTIVGARLRTIREYTKEALKATQIGSDSVAFLLLEGKKHKPLGEFADTTVEVSVDGGSGVTVPFEKFEKAAQGVE